MRRIKYEIVGGHQTIQILADLLVENDSSAYTHA